MIKRLLLLLLGVLLCYSVMAQDFEVTKAQVDISIQEKGYFDVVEKYDINFFSPRHGIFRDIQLVYNLQDAKGKHEKRRIKISRVKVPGHSFSNDFSFTQSFQDFFKIKIGDKNALVNGSQHYEIRYRVHNAFLFDDSLVQFYWNIKPNGWATTFNEINFNITVPKDIPVNLKDFFVYAGEAGNTSGGEHFETSYSDGVFRVKSKPGFSSLPGESVTVLLKMPKGSIHAPGAFGLFLSRYSWVLVLVIIIIIFSRVWYKYGKDDKVVSTTSYFPPKGVDPPMAGFLIDDKSDNRDLTCLIPYWGARGIIRMEEIPKKGLFGKKDTKLIRSGVLPEDSPDYEMAFFEGLFGSNSEGAKEEVLISSLQNVFYITMRLGQEKLKSRAQKYYDPKARKIKRWTMGGLLLGGVILGIIFLFIWGIAAVISLVVVFLILIALSPSLVKKNSKGNTALSDLKGFKQFIKVAEENKLKMLLKENPHYFEDTLGYAVAFGMLERWAKKFADLDLEPPGWYTSTAGIIGMSHFTESFSGTMNAAQSTMMSTPSSSSGSSGGGFSGGGFGGGGGGSW